MVYMSDHCDKDFSEHIELWNPAFPLKYSLKVVQNGIAERRHYFITYQC